MNNLKDLKIKICINRGWSQKPKINFTDVGNMKLNWPFIIFTKIYSHNPRNLTKMQLLPNEQRKKEFSERYNEKNISNAQKNGIRRSYAFYWMRFFFSFFFNFWKKSKKNFFSKKKIKLRKFFKFYCAQKTKSLSRTASKAQDIIKDRKFYFYYFKLNKINFSFQWRLLPSFFFRPFFSALSLWTSRVKMFWVPLLTILPYLLFKLTRTITRTKKFYHLEPETIV